MADMAGEFMADMAAANPEMAGMMAAGMTQMMGNQGAGFMAEMSDFMGADMAQQLQADMQAGMADMASMMQAQMQAGDMFMGPMMTGDMMGPADFGGMMDMDMGMLPGMDMGMGMDPMAGMMGMMGPDPMMMGMGPMKIGGKMIVKQKIKNGTKGVRTNIRLSVPNERRACAHLFFTKEKFFTKNLKSISKDFDYILFDCPPALNLLTINAIEYSKKVLVPVQCEYYALEGLVTLKNTIEQLNAALDLKIKIVAILRTMADGRNRLTREVSDQLEKHFKQTVLNTIIPRNVRLAEAPSYGQSIVDYDIKSIGAEAFLSLAGEFIRKFENGKKNISK